MKNFFVQFYVKNAYHFFPIFWFFLTGAVLEPSFSNVAQKFWYILLDLCESFQILESGDFSFFLTITLKRKVKNWVSKKNYTEDLRLHRQILIELSRKIPNIVRELTSW